MSDARCQIRPAGVAGLAQSFAFSRAGSGRSYPALLAEDGACLLLAVNGHERLGCLMGSGHLTFYASGPVAGAGEVFVRSQYRGRGVGRALMSASGQWAAARNCSLVALATRRAAPFHRALGLRGLPSTSARSWTTEPANNPVGGL